MWSYGFSSSSHCHGQSLFLLLGWHFRAVSSFCDSLVDLACYEVWCFWVCVNSSLWALVRSALFDSYYLLVLVRGDVWRIGVEEGVQHFPNASLHSLRDAVGYAGPCSLLSTWSCSASSAVRCSTVAPNPSCPTCSGLGWEKDRVTIRPSHLPSPLTPPTHASRPFPVQATDMRPN